MSDISRRTFIGGSALAALTGLAAAAPVAALAADTASTSASGSGSVSASSSASGSTSASASGSVSGSASASASTGSSIAISASASTSASDAQPGALEGTAATGTGMGKHGTIEVQVIVDGGTLKDIQILTSRELSGLGDVAMARMAAEIVDGQTLNVDTVTGATLTSSAFLQAVGNALDAAGEDSSEWSNRDHVSPTDVTDVTTDADVIVVGAGGAGMCAAISAFKKGASVIVLEKMGTAGGDTALSGGEMAVPNNWIQAQDPTIEDSPELLASDMLAGGDNLGDPDLVNIIANGTFDASQWLTFEGGVSWEPDLLFFGGHSVERSIIPTNHTGSSMTTKLMGKIETYDIPFYHDMQATDLVTADDGSVTGVKATDLISGTEYTFTGKAVVLATGGFGSNVDMRVQYNPDMDSTILSTDSVGATGDGLVMASAIGAELIDMQYIQTYPTCDPVTGALLYVGDMRLESLAIMIDKEGDRFVEELDRRDVLSDAIKKQTDGMAYMLFNQAGADKTGLLDIHADEYENLLARGIIAKGDTLADACKPFGIDSDELQKTVDRWNGFCKEGKDEDFNYRSDLNPIEDGPYYILEYKPAVHYTMGGLHIDTSAEVLKEDGSVIPGLFAAGEVAGHKMGDNRLGSCSMADIYVFGRIAGENAVAFGA